MIYFTFFIFSQHSYSRQDAEKKILKSHPEHGLTLSPAAIFRYHEECLLVFSVVMDGGQGK